MPKIKWDLEEYNSLHDSLRDNIRLLFADSEEAEKTLRAMDVIALSDHENTKMAEFNQLCKKVEQLYNGIGFGSCYELDDYKKFVNKKPTHSGRVQEIKAARQQIEDNESENWGCLVFFLIGAVFYMSKCTGSKETGYNPPAIEQKTEVKSFASRFTPRQTTDWAERETLRSNSRG